MDGFSVTSLTSLCASISSRAAANVGELGGLVGNSPPNQRQDAGLRHLLTGHRTLSDQATQTKAALEAAVVISEQLQQTLNQFLTSCDGALAVLGKQLMRLQPDSLHLVDRSATEKYHVVLATYTGQFAFLNTVLPIERRETQDASLDAGRGMIAHAEELSRAATSGNGILLDQADAYPYYAPEPTSQAGSSRHSARQEEADGEADEPPPYVETEPAGSPPGPRSSDSNAGGGLMSLSSFTKPLKALASSLSSKSEPLVCALCQAGSRGDIQNMGGLLSQGANINGRDDDGHTPLQCAILSDQADAARFLLDAGADSKGSVPPLFLAATTGSLAVAKALVERGADVHARSMSGEAYFAGVVAKQNVAGAKFLLENGADPNATDVSGQPVLATAVKRANLDLTRVLLEHGADIRAKAITGSSLLTMAVGRDDERMVALLLDRGASPDSSGLSGAKVLVESISRRRLDFARTLLDRGANGNVKDVWGQPALIMLIKDSKIAEQDKVDMIGRLLRHGAPPDAEDKAWGVPAVCHAMELGNTDLVALLLGHNAKLTPLMDGGETLLLHAIDHGRLDQVRLLLSYGADPRKADKRGRTPLAVASQRQDRVVLQLLSQYGVGASGGSQSGSSSRAAASVPGRSESPPPGYDFKTG